MAGSPEPREIKNILAKKCLTRNHHSKYGKFTRKGFGLCGILASALKERDSLRAFLFSGLYRRLRVER